MIWLGGVFGGPELDGTQFDKSLMEINRKLELLPQKEEGSDGSIDIVFHVPGSQLSVDFEGVRAGKFSRKKGVFMVQVAVPEEEIRKRDNFTFMFWAIRQAVVLSATVFSEAGIPFDRAYHFSLIDRLQEKVSGA